MDSKGPSSLTQETMPQQDVAVAAQDKETAVINTPEPTGFNFNEKKRPAALNLTHQRTGTSSSSSSESSLKVPRTPRFAEATSVHSPVDDDKISPFADPVNPQASESQPSDVGFGYIGSNSNRESIPMAPKSPLKSAMKVPGTPARTMHILSPTFREEAILEKRELETEKEQARDIVSLLSFLLFGGICQPTNLYTETQGPRSHGQIRPSKRPLQLLSHYPRHALLVIRHLQRH